MRPNSSVAPGAIDRKSALSNLGSVLAMRYARNAAGWARLSGTWAFNEAAAIGNKARRPTAMGNLGPVMISPSWLFEPRTGKRVHRDRAECQESFTRKNVCDSLLHQCSRLLPRVKNHDLRRGRPDVTAVEDRGPGRRLTLPM